MTKIIKLVEERGMCSLPWAHAYIAFHDNKIKPCCHYRGETGRISNGLSNEWFNDSAVELRTRWINGEHIPECGHCDVGEGSFSYKKWKNTFYSNSFDFLHTTDVDQPQLPSIFHINLDNTCNLACRMCTPSNSSKIFQMVKKHPSLEKYLLRAEPSKKINTESLRGSFKNTRLVSFTGGEPMLNDDTIEIIKIIKQESTNLARVSFTTNMTIINDEILEALDELGVDIAISISIDGTPSTHDYVRYGCNWQTMIDNLIYICEKYPRFRYSVNTTVSSLTAGYITDILDIVRNLEIRLGIKFEHLMASPVTDKRFMNPGLLPQSIKDIYLKKLQQYCHESTIPGDYRLIETAREMLNSSGSTDDLRNFVDYIKQFDAIANTNVLDVYPEFKELF